MVTTFFKMFFCTVFCNALVGNSTLAMPLSSEREVELHLPENDCSFAGNFNQVKQLKGLPIPLESSGQFYYHCEYGVVWQTQLPVPETLVFKQTGLAYLVTGDTIEPLKSKQGRVLGRLLNGLIGADQGAIREQFSIGLEPKETDVANQSIYLLTPTTRDLRRVLKLIKLTIPSPAADTNLAITIAMLDRKQQWTTIEAINKTTANASPEKHACSVTLDMIVCDLLFQTKSDKPISEDES